MKLLLFVTIIFFGSFACSLQQSCPAWPHPLKTKLLDIQGHRGGKGYYPDNTLYSYANGIQIGENTLEMDMHITKDGYVVMSHDGYPNPMQCKDTKPVTPKDSLFPYADGNKNIIDLTFAQIRTLDCGHRHSDVPHQKIVPGAKMPLFTEVIDLVKCYGDPNILLNSEIKYDADAPKTTATRAQFVSKVKEILVSYDFVDRVTIQSFDWESLILMKKALPSVITVALVDETTAVYGSNWLAGIDIYDKKYSGSIVQMAHSIGADVLSPIHGFNTVNISADATAATKGYFPYTTKTMCDEAHSYGMKVIPWTCNDAATINKVIKDGADGVIGNYPLLTR